MLYAKIQDAQYEGGAGVLPFVPRVEKPEHLRAPGVFAKLSQPPAFANEYARRDRLLQSPPVPGDEAADNVPGFLPGEIVAQP